MRGLVGLDDAAVRLLAARRRRERGQRVDQVADAEIAQRAAEEDRRQVPSRKACSVERPAGLDGEPDLLREGVPLVLGQQEQRRRPDRRAVDLQRLLVGVEPAHLRAGDVVGAGEGLRPRPIGQLAGAVSSASVFSISSSRSNGSRRLAVHLVDEGDDGDVAQAADLEQLARARLDALGRVDHHDGAVDGGQRAVGVLGEVLVARRVEQVEDAVRIFERHHRGDDGDAALLLDPHPVGPGADAVLLGLDLAGELDRAAEQQQLLGQRRLARVGMRDDGEGPAPGHRIGHVGHGREVAGNGRQFKPAHGRRRPTRPGSAARPGETGAVPRSATPRTRSRYIV